MPVFTHYQTIRIKTFMRKSILHKLLAFSGSALLLLQSCKDDSYLASAPAIVDQSSFTEEFDTTAAALSRGWKIYNKSEPVGGSVWQDGGNILPLFNSYSNYGSNVGFTGVDYLSTSAEAGIISQWLVSPVVFMQNGDKIVFYSKAQKSIGYTADDSTDFANRLQLRVNTDNTNPELVGSGMDAGSFKTTLVDINPNYYEWHKNPGVYNGVDNTAPMIAQAYPVEWTRFEGTVSGLNQPTNGRFAFRYYVIDGGSNGRGTGVGIDKVEYISVSR